MSTSKKLNHIKDSTQQEVDLMEIQELLDYNLSLSEEDRLLNHQRALDTINELIKARKQIYGEFESSIETPS